VVPVCTFGTVSWGEKAIVMAGIAGIHGCLSQVHRRFTGDDMDGKIAFEAAFAIEAHRKSRSLPVIRYLRMDSRESARPGFRTAGNMEAAASRFALRR